MTTIRDMLRSGAMADGAEIMPSHVGLWFNLTVPSQGRVGARHVGLRAWLDAEGDVLMEFKTDRDARKGASAA